MNSIIITEPNRFHVYCYEIIITTFWKVVRH